MSTHFCRIIHQQANYLYWRLVMVILRAKRLCRCQNILNNSSHFLSFRQTCCKILSLFDVMTTKLPQLLLPKVSHCIPVLSSRYIGECAARVLKRSDENQSITLAGVVTPSKPPPPTNNFCLYPPPVLTFWKGPLITPTPPPLPHFKHLSLLPPPHPHPFPLSENFNHTQDKSLSTL